MKIGIKSADHILAKGNMVTNEVDTLIENFKILKEVFEIFKNSLQAYRIMQANYDREAEDPARVKVIIDMLDKSRYFCGELLERFKMFERNHIASVRHNSLKFSEIKEKGDRQGKIVINGISVSKHPVQALVEKISLA